MRVRPLLGIVACLLAINGCATPQHETGEAAPAGSPAKPSVSPDPSAVPVVTALTLGPTGYGVLQLGMSRQQSQATGLITGYTDPGADQGCPFAMLKGAPDNHDMTGIVMFARSTGGLVLIGAYGSMATPEGIRIGSTGKAVHVDYPDALIRDPGGDNEYGDYFAPIERNPNAEYRILVQQSHVVYLILETIHDECYD
jgi:hypothetical protein